MKIIKLISCFIILLFFYFCESSPQTLSSVSNTCVSNNYIIVDIQPFEDLPDSTFNYINNELKKISSDIEVKKAIPFPKSALNYNKTRYRADSLISYLSDNTPAGHVTIGLTTKDISTTKGRIKDWGVMGLGYCPGNACIASTYRLNKEKVLEQFFKVAIHELGHTQGLPHCPVKTCFMRDAEGKNHTDEEIEFCSECRQQLLKTGWNLN